MHAAMPPDQTGHGKSGKEKKEKMENKEKDGKPDRSLCLLVPLSELWPSLADLQAGAPLGLKVRGQEFCLLVRGQETFTGVIAVSHRGRGRKDLDWFDLWTGASQVAVVATFAGRPVDGLAFPVQELSVCAC
jgi:hypothetical protein